ncbi:MAG: hypothetical protein ACP5MB_02605 [bacterium]
MPVIFLSEKLEKVSKMNNMLKLFIILSVVLLGASNIYARQVADPLDTHARLILGFGTETWDQNSNINGIQKMHQSNFSGYLEEDAEGLYIASHITLLAGGLGSVTFSDGTSTSNTFMTNINMDFQGVCYTEKGIAVMIGPYIGLTAVGIGGESTSSALLGSSFSGNAESIVVSSMGISARVHAFIGDHVDLALQGFYGFWIPYSNITLVSAHASTSLLGGGANTTTMSYYFDNISDAGVNLEVGIRFMRQLGVIIGGRYEDIVASGNNSKNINIDNINSFVALGLWF